MLSIISTRLVHYLQKYGLIEECKSGDTFYNKNVKELHGVCIYRMNNPNQSQNSQLFLAMSSYEITNEEDRFSYIMLRTGWSFQNVARTYILEMENGRQLETRPRLVLGKTSLECSLTRSNLALNSASESLSMA